MTVTVSTWVPSINGLVIKILSVSAGIANLDISGSGQPATSAALAAIGVTDAERQQFATLYAPGQSLWRVATPHFSPWDFNWPASPPPDATPPNQIDPKLLGTPETDPCEAQGSIIECQNQVLGERLPIVGTRYNLNYRSSRANGRTAASTLQISLSGSSVPASLKAIVLEISVAGRQFNETFSPAPNQNTKFTWDGKDAYGRSVQGQQPITIRIGYTYEGVYYMPSQNPALAAGTPLFSRFPYAGIPIPGLARQEVTLFQVFQSSIGSSFGVWDARAQGLGGWSLNTHHAYDPAGRVLYKGDGSQQRTAHGINVLRTVAGNGDGNFSGDGGPALAAGITPITMALSPDGSLYISDQSNQDSSRIRRVGPDGIITTVAGTGQFGFSGDGGPATGAQMGQASGLALGPDGSLYIADSSNLRIRRMAPDGIITTIAGNGQRGFSGDGGPATQAAMGTPVSLAVGPDGSIYIGTSDPNDNARIRHVGPDGIITTIAGNGQHGFAGDGGPAAQATLGGISVIRVSPDGNLYFGDFAFTDTTFTSTSHRVRRIGPNGIITTIAGISSQGSSGGFSGDGGPAIQAQLSVPSVGAIGTAGSIYINSGATRIRRVGPDGIITTVAGNGQQFSGIMAPDGTIATSVPVGGARGIDPDGSLYILDSNRVRKVAPPFPGFSTTDSLIASPDGSELYHFNSMGRHLSTQDALTGATLYQFGYDGAGRLITVMDRSGNITTIERDGSGNPDGIVGPFGQRTSLTLDANGFLASVTNPAGESTSFTSTTNGLITSLTEPRGGVHRFSYDLLGRLAHDADPAGGSSALSRIDGTSDYTVSLTTALNRTRTYQVQNLSTGNRQRVNTDPSGLRSVEQIGTNGSRTITAPDGTLTSLLQGPDPRFGMEAPITASSRITTPGGLQLNMTSSRSVVLTDPNNILSLNTMTNTATINGRTSTSVYDAVSRKFTMTTPAGRKTFATLDAQGRLVQSQVTGLEAATSTYDSRGRTASVSTGTGVDTRTMTFSYNSDGYVQTITDPLGRTVDFAYDSAGRVIQQILPDAGVITYAYDANGNVTTITPPDRPAHDFSFTPVDLISAYVPPDASAGTNQTLYAYNADRQLTQVSHPDGQTIDLGYNSAGRLNALTIPDGVFNYAYDPTKGHLAMIGAPGGIGLAYTYDGELPTQTTWSGPVAGSVSRTFDNNFRTTSLSVGGTPISFSYDNDNLLTQAGALTLSRNAQNGLLTGTTLGSATDTWTYNAFGEPIGYSAAFVGSTVFAQQYTRDKLGRITQKTETIGGVTDIFAYSYDLAGQLTEVKRNGAITASYVYDSNGNRLTLTTSSGTIIGSYDNQDRLTQFGFATYAYNANGDLQRKSGAPGQITTYQYDALGNLRAVVLPGGTQISYLIDGNNRRIGKQVNGTLIQGFLYQDRLKPIAEVDGGNNIVSSFVYATHSNVPDYMIKGGVMYRIFSDHLGSPRLVVNSATGAVLQRIDYDEFGQVLNDSNPGFQPFGFAGGLYDGDTKLVRFGLRDYDSQTGRWTAKDPILFRGRNSNLYQYVNADPVNHIDRNGTSVLKSIGEFFEMIGEATSAIVANMTGSVSATAAQGNHIDLVDSFLASATADAIPYTGSAGEAIEFALKPENAINITNALEAVTGTNSATGFFERIKDFFTKPSNSLPINDPIETDRRYRDQLNCP